MQLVTLDLAERTRFTAYNAVSTRILNINKLHFLVVSKKALF